jgi:hypothetical protein
MGLLPAARAQTTTATWSWAARGAGSGSTAPNNIARLVRADAAGNTYVTGTFEGTLTLGSFSLTAARSIDSYLAKYTPTGSVAWVRQLSSPDQESIVYALALDGANNVYVSGYFYGAMTIGTLALVDPTYLPPNTGSANGFVVKLDPQGTVQWGTRIGQLLTGPGGSANCSSLAIDAAGNIAIAGTLTGTIDLAGTTLTTGAGQALYVARLGGQSSAAPTVQWTSLSSPASYSGQVKLGFDAAGSLYLGIAVTGNITLGIFALFSSNTLPDIILARYDAGGTVQWATRLPPPPPGSTATDVSIRAMAVTLTGEMYVLTQGAVPPSYSPSEYQLGHYPAPGTAAWQYTMPTPASSTAFAGLDTDADGNVYLAGGFTTSVSLGGLTLSTANPGDSEAFLFSLSPLGTGRWALQASTGTGTEVLLGVAVGPGGVLHVAGAVSGAAQLGPFSLPATSTGYEQLAGRLSVSTVSATRAGAASPLLLAPNPAHGSAILTLPAAPTAQPLILLDALGRPVRHYTVPVGATTAPLDVTGLPAGLYVLRGASASRKLVLE